MVLRHRFKSRIGKLFAFSLMLVWMRDSLLTVLMIMMKLSDSCESRLMVLSVRLFMTDGGVL